MSLVLNHCFILTAPGAAIADALVELGLTETGSRVHAGQGTANRCFHFANGMLEFLWVHDEDEARQGPGQGLRLADRANNPDASLFGLILHRSDDDGPEPPFSGWAYQPDYFPEGKAFHIGANSDDISEPLCIYLPFLSPQAVPEPNSQSEAGSQAFDWISQVIVYTPQASPSETLEIAGNAVWLQLKGDMEHRMEIVFDDHRQDKRHDFRPAIPLVVYW